MSQWAMIECPYCKVQQPAPIKHEIPFDLAADDVPDVLPVSVVADMTLAKTHVQTCRSRRTR